MNNSSHSSAIVFLVDYVWIEYAKQLICSVHFHAGWKGDYVMLAVDLPETELQWFRDRGVLIFRCPDLAKKLSIPIDKLKTTIYRIWMFSDSFKRWEYLIYLDLDIIVRGDLSYLLNHKKIMAAWDSNRNNLGWQLKGENSLLDYKLLNQYLEIGKIYDLNAPSFNAGVLSVHHSNIGKIVFEELCEIYRKYFYLFSSHINDQALLNIFFYKNWIKLPAQFNIYANFSDINYRKNMEKLNPFVLHFAGTQQNHKPWHKENPYYLEWQANYELKNEFDVLHKHNSKKTEEYRQIEEESVEVEKLWENIREFEKKFHSFIWWVKNPFNLIKRIYN